MTTSALPRLLLRARSREARSCERNRANVVCVSFELALHFHQFHVSLLKTSSRFVRFLGLTKDETEEESAKHVGPKDPDDDRRVFCDTTTIDDG